MRILKEYNQFIAENINQAKAIFNKKLEEYEKLKKLLASNIGYVGKFTQYLFHENVPYEELEKLYKDLVYLKSKNASFDISELKYEKVLDQIQQSKENISIKLVINQFPGTQKKFINDLLNDEHYESSEVRNALYKISQKDYQAFISKISRYKTSGELSQAIKIFSKDSNDQKDVVIKELEKMKSHVVYDRGNILIVKIESYNDIKVLGSNTSWCIVRLEHTFNSYVKGRYQFILYNYDLDDCDADFKIGFTLDKDLSICSCHNILDHGAKQTLRNLFTEHNIKYENLIPKREPLVYDLSKITARTTNDIIDQLCEECKFEEIPIVIKKVLSLRKGSSFTENCIRKLCNRYYADKSYVKQSDIDKIDTDLFVVLNETNFRNKILYSKYNGSIFTLYGLEEQEDRISNQIDYWANKEICKIEDDAFDSIYNIRYKREISITSPRLSKDLITKISNRLNQAYKNVNSVKDYRPDIKNDNLFGYKLLKETEITMLLFNIALDRKEQTPDYNNIIKHISGYAKCRYAKLLQLPIDLDDSSINDLPDDVIKLVIKKDYDKKAVISVNKDNYDQCLKLINHLEGHRIMFNINSKYLREQYGYQKDDPIHRAIRKFKVTRLTNGEMRTEGNVSIIVYTNR